LISFIRRKAKTGKKGWGNISDGLGGDNMVEIIAHRGSSGHAPENTASAFLKALEHKTDMVEFDVAITKDGIPVIFHDTKMKRLTGQPGIMGQYTLNQIKKLDAGSWFHPDYHQERILTLEEGINLLRATRINVEIKPDSAGHEKKILDIVRNAGILYDVLFSSVSARILKNMQHIDNKLNMGVVAGGILWKGSLKTALDLKCKSINPRMGLLSAKLVSSAHSHGLKVLAWTINKESDMCSAAKMGVDGIFTNYPDRLKKVLDEMH